MLRFSGLQAIHRTATRQLELDGNYMACIAVLEALDNGIRATSKRSTHGAGSASRMSASASASASSLSASLSSVAGGTSRASGKAAVGAADGNAASSINADDGDDVNASDADDVNADHDNADTVADLGSGMADGDPLSCNFTATWARHAPHLRRARTSKRSPFHTIHRSSVHNARNQSGSGNGSSNGSVGANGRRLTKFEQHHQQEQQQLLEQQQQQNKSPTNGAFAAAHQQQRSMSSIESADVYVSPAVALNSPLPLPLPLSASAPVSASVELAALLALPTAAFDAGTSGLGCALK